MTGCNITTLKQGLHYSCETHKCEWELKTFSAIPPLLCPVNNESLYERMRSELAKDIKEQNREIAELRSEVYRLRQEKLYWFRESEKHCTRLKDGNI